MSQDQEGVKTTREHEDEQTWSKQELLAYKASTDPDTMYHHQAMKQTLYKVLIHR